MGSVIMCHVCKWSLKWGQGPKPKRDIFAGTKNNKKITGTKTKTRHICKDQNHILALFLCWFKDDWL